MNWNSAAEQFVEALSSPDPTPGGGAAAAMTGAMGCALALMAIGTTLKRKTLDAAVKARLEKHAQRLASFKVELKGYIQKDAQAYEAYLTAKKLPKENPARAQALENSLYFAASVPCDTATAAHHALREIKTCADDIAPIIFSDVLCAQHLLRACMHCALENVRTNLTYIQNPSQQEGLKKQITRLEKEL